MDNRLVMADSSWERALANRFQQMRTPSSLSGMSSMASGFATLECVSVIVGVCTIPPLRSEKLLGLRNDVLLVVCVVVSLTAAVVAAGCSWGVLAFGGIVVACLLLFGRLPVTDRKSVV